MKTRIAIALVASAILIGSALLSRTASKDKENIGVLSVREAEISEEEYQDFLQDFLSPRPSTTTPLTYSDNSTDLLGKQLVLDYVNLAATGQLTNSGINNLVNQYAESIPALVQFKSIKESEIIVVPDNKVNFQSYDERLGKILLTHAQSLGYDSKEPSTSIPSPSLLKNSYEKTTLELKNLPVPKSLSSLHLDLANTYFVTAQTAAMITSPDEDPGQTLAAIILIDENLNKEAVTLNEIVRILRSKI